MRASGEPMEFGIFDFYKVFSRAFGEEEDGVSSRTPQWIAKYPDADTHGFCISVGLPVFYVYIQVQVYEFQCANSLLFS